MNKSLSLILLGCLSLLLALTLIPRPVQALPEYSAQTGEPCATCHISPSGGGARAPRGQAWVGSGKPGAVPELVDALEILGVHLDVDESAYTTVPETIEPAQALPLEKGQVDQLQHWLSSYDGN